MKTVLVAIVAVIGTILILQSTYTGTKCYEGTVTPVFSPTNSEEIFNVISDAKHEIKLEVYEFSSKDLADALIGAKKRGVSIRVIMDPSVYQNNGIFRYLVNNGIDVKWASNFQITHSKFMIVDDGIVFVGSMNWSDTSLKSNREASVIVYSTEVSKKFEDIFDSDFA